MNRNTERTAVTTPRRDPETQTREQSSGSEGLSLQTLVIAALASGAAAVVTSFIWPGGTVVSAAMTPVIVSVVREALQRPAQRIANVRTGRLGETLNVGLREQVGRSGGRPVDLKRGLRLPRLRLPGFKRPVTFDDAPYGRVYGRSRVRLKAAVATGMLAFVIAAVVLTLPELVFGGSVTGNRSSTFFGGGSQPAKQAPPKGQPPPSSPQIQTAPKGGSDSGQSQGGGGTGGSGPSGSQPQNNQSPGRAFTQSQTTPQQGQPSQGERSTQTPTSPGGGISVP